MTEFDDSTVARFWAKVYRNGPILAHVDGLSQCWIWVSTRDIKGYGKLRVLRRLVSAHRISWILANGPVGAEKPCILHYCDNPSCVRPSHLWAGTYLDNNRDRERKSRGRHPSGDSHFARRHPELFKAARPPAQAGGFGPKKLTPEAVRSIRTDAAAGISHAAIAKQYGVTTANISSVVVRRTWKHVD